MKARYFKIFLSTVIGSLLTLSSNAQDSKVEVKPAATTQTKKAPAAPNAKPIPTKPVLNNIPANMQSMLRFMGRWSANATLTKDGKTRQVEYHIVGRSGAGGNAVSIDEYYNDSIMGNMKGTNLIGYDPNDQKIHWYSVDNQGTTHEHIGSWATADSLHIEHNSMNKGKSYNEKIDFVFASRDELRFKLIATLDDKDVLKVTGVFHREKQERKEKQISTPAEKK